MSLEKYRGLVRKVIVQNFFGLCPRKKFGCIFGFKSLPPKSCVFDDFIFLEQNRKNYFFRSFIRPYQSLFVRSLSLCFVFFFHFLLKIFFCLKFFYLLFESETSTATNQVLFVLFYFLLNKTFSLKILFFVFFKIVFVLQAWSRMMVSRKTFEFSSEKFRISGGIFGVWEESVNSRLFIQILPNSCSASLEMTATLSTRWLWRHASYDVMNVGASDATTTTTIKLAVADCGRMLPLVCMRAGRSAVTEIKLMLISLQLFRLWL